MKFFNVICMKLTKKEKSWLVKFAAFSLIFVVALQTGLLSQFGLDPIGFQSGYDEDRTQPVTYEVYCKITTRTLLSKSTVDVVVNMYDLDGNFIDTVTTSSGIGTFGMMLPVGTHVLLQARPNTPASADPYITPVSEWVVPSAGESADTVSLRNVETDESILWLRDVASSAPSFTVTDGLGNSVSDKTKNYFNTTDNALKISLTLSVSNTYYGAEDFVDYETGKEYAGGVWFVWKGTTTQAFTNYDYTFSNPDNVYYIWKISDGIFYDVNGNVADASVSATIPLQSGSTFSTDATVVLDCYDMLWLNGNGAPQDANAFINGGAIDVSAITTKVA